MQSLFRNGKRGQILILMATTLMAILLVTTLASVRTFKPVRRDPEATVILIKSQTRRAVLNSLAVASLTGDTDTDRFGQNLQSQFRNIAAGHAGLSLGVSDIHSLQFSWDTQDEGVTATSVTLQIVELQYKLDYSESMSYTLQLKIDELTRQTYEQFEELRMNVTLTMNGGPSPIKGASVTVDQTHRCEITRNYGNGKYYLLVIVPTWDRAPPFELNIIDENNVKVVCTFVPPA